ncbi:pseudoazurin [Rhodoferax sp. U11-2br]|nr:pseudoazurin [Rhodoferax sp. U11-2br]
MQMRKLFSLVFAASVWLVSPSCTWAETYQVKMLNRNHTGPMPFEADYLKLKSGDKVQFLASNIGHNAASIVGMMPEGASPFKGKVNEEILVEFTKKGFYGIQCVPHYGMGMVMLVQVGDASLDELVIPDAVPDAAKKRFQKIIERAKAKK